MTSLCNPKQSKLKELRSHRKPFVLRRTLTFVIALTLIYCQSPQLQYKANAMTKINSLSKLKISLNVIDTTNFKGSAALAFLLVIFQIYGTFHLEKSMAGMIIATILLIFIFLYWALLFYGKYSEAKHEYYLEHTLIKVNNVYWDPNTLDAYCGDVKCKHPINFSQLSFGGKPHDNAACFKCGNENVLINRANQRTSYRDTIKLIKNIVNKNVKEPIR